MEVTGLTIDPVNNAPIVVLREHGGERLLPIWIGVVEASSIAFELEGVKLTRPMTHDLLRNVIQDLKATVERIVVCDVQDNTFYALIHLTREGQAMTIDARPSDAIALALRTRAPIFVEENVIDHAKTVDFSPDKPDAERLHKWLESLDPEDLGKYKM